MTGLADEREPRKCPFINAGCEFLDNCLKENCGIWDDETGSCAILALATGINLMLRRGERKE